MTPPHVELKDLRAAVGITLDQLIVRVNEVCGLEVTRGAISAIENGHRGASAELLEAIARAYNMRPDALSTTYRPRAAESRCEVTE
jgi:transcriptional regulator with XRE-family HTH domain